MKLTIHSKTYEYGDVCLGQDEMLAPILREMIDEHKATFTDLSKIFSSAIRSDGTNVNVSVAAALNAAGSRIGESTLDIIKLFIWLSERKYLRRFLAICLVPDGKEFSPDAVPAIEDEMIHAQRGDALKVFSSFFGAKKSFGKSTSNSSAAEENETRS